MATTDRWGRLRRTAPFVVLATLVVSSPTLGDPMRPLVPPATLNAMPPLDGGPLGVTPRPTSTRADPPPPRLLATRRTGDDRWEALVGRTWVKTGDRVGDGKVREVHNDRLVLQVGGRQETLYLLPPLTPFTGRPPVEPDPPAAARPPSPPRPSSDRVARTEAGAPTAEARAPLLTTAPESRP
jgi:hypothetical protein